MPLIPSPLDVLRALPSLGVNLILPALVIGAVMGSMVDILLGNEGYPFAKVGLLLGPVVFALTINALHRREQEDIELLANLAETYRKEETARRRKAAEACGDLPKPNGHLRSGR